MKELYSINVCKEYFNFSSSHFIIFQNGERERLHGHNYYVSFKGHCNGLINDMVFDFLKIKPIIKEICKQLDHYFLLPAKNEHLSYQKIKKDGSNYLKLTLSDSKEFIFPEEDVKILPLENISSERLAIYLAKEIKKSILKTFNFTFSSLEVEVEETNGQSAIYTLVEENL